MQRLTLFALFALLPANESRAACPDLSGHYQCDALSYTITQETTPDNVTTYSFRSPYLYKYDPLRTVDFVADGKGHYMSHVRYPVPTKDSAEDIAKDNASRGFYTGTCRGKTLTLEIGTNENITYLEQIEFTSELVLNSKEESGNLEFSMRYIVERIYIYLDRGTVRDRDKDQTYTADCIRTDSPQQ